MSNLTDKLNALDNVDLLSVARMCRMPDSKYHFNKSTPKDALIEMIQNYSLENRDSSDAVHRSLHIIKEDYVSSDDVQAAPAAPAAPAAQIGTDPLSLAINSMVTTQLEGVKADMVDMLQGMRPTEKVITVVRGERKELPDDTFLHSKFEEVLQLLQHGMHVMLVGPSGSGKTHLAKQVALILSAPFSATPITLGTTKSDLLGSMLPLGEAGTFEYVPSPFIKSFENGGVHLLDEIDKFDPNMGALANMPLANGMVGLPQRPDAPMAIEHEDSYYISTANTYGTGTDGQYAGSVRQDMATLNRWKKVYIDYDSKLEESIVDADVLVWGRKFRKLLIDNGMPRFLSTRDLLDYSKLKAGTYAPFKKLSYWHGQATMGWKTDEIAKVKGALK